jgi:hypothetical protein
MLKAKNIVGAFKRILIKRFKEETLKISVD